MSLIRAIKSANDEKHSSAGAEGGDISHVHQGTSTAIRTVSCSTDVMDDLILHPHSQLPNLFYLCSCCSVGSCEKLPAGSNLEEKRRRFAPAVAYLIRRR